jgi:hypothetical protein
VQIDGIEMDDAWAGRLRAAGGRIVYFKAKKSLAVHRDGGAPAAAAPPAAPPAAATPPGVPLAPPRRATASPALRWVEATIDGIMDARASDS